MTWVDEDRGLIDDDDDEGVKLYRDARREHFAAVRVCYSVRIKLQLTVTYRGKKCTHILIAKQLRKPK